MIEDVPNPVERDTYRQRLARLLRVDERALLGAYPAPSRPRARRPQPAAGRAKPAEATPAPLSPSHTLEVYCLGVLLRHPDLLYALDRALQEAGLARLGQEDFNHTDHQLVFRLVQESVEQDESEPQPYVRSHAPEPLGDLIQNLLAVDQASLVPAEPNPDRILEDLVRRAVQLRMNNINQALNQIRYLQEETQEEGDLRAAAFQDLVSDHIQVRLLLDRALRQSSPHN